MRKSICPFAPITICVDLINTWEIASALQYPRGGLVRNQPLGFPGLFFARTVTTFRINLERFACRILPFMVPLAGLPSSVLSVSPVTKSRLSFNRQRLHRDDFTRLIAP